MSLYFLVGGGDARRFHSENNNNNKRYAERERQTEREREWEALSEELSTHARS